MMDQEEKLRELAGRIRVQARVMEASWVESRGGSKEHYEFMSQAHRGHFNDIASEIEALLSKAGGE